jgi:membrane protease YdiL (CAAX protease family)
MHWDYAAIIVFLGAIMPFLGRRRVQRLLLRPETTGSERLRLYSSTILMQWLLVALIFWRAQAHRTIARDLGLAIPNPGLAIIVSVGLAGSILANQLLALRMAGRVPQESGGITAQLAFRIFPQASVERLVFFLVVVTVAICEEFIYRGFLQYLFASVSGSVAAGVLVSALFFSIAHLYQGRRGLITAYIVGLLFGAVRAWTGALIPGMIAHFVADLAAGFLLPARLREIAAGRQIPFREDKSQNQKSQK